MEHQNLSVVRRLYQAFASRDASTIAQMAGSDLSLHVAGRSRFAGVHRGAEAVLKVFYATGVETDHSLRVEMHALMGDGDHVVGLHRLTASRRGRALDQNGCVVCHVHDGSVKDVWLVVEDQYAFDEFWA